MRPMNELSTYPKEETAYEWFRRVQQNKRKISLNPIAFPPFHGNGTSASTDADTDSDIASILDHGDQSLSSFPSQFNVTNQNIINLWDTFFSTTASECTETHHNFRNVHQFGDEAP